MGFLKTVTSIYLLGLLFFFSPAACAVYDAAEMKKIEELFKSTVKPDGAMYFTYVPRGLIVSIDEDVFFNKAQEKIKKEGISILNAIGAVLEQTDKLCVIEGHTESADPELSNYAENWELSLARAHSITMYLMRYLKISPERLYCIGYGEFMPYSDNVSKDANLNNRIDFVIINYRSDR